MVLLFWNSNNMCLFVVLFVCLGLFFLLKNFYPYGGVTVGGEGLQILTMIGGYLAMRVKFCVHCSYNFHQLPTFTVNYPLAALELVFVGVPWSTPV